MVSPSLEESPAPKRSRDCKSSIFPRHLENFPSLHASSCHSTMVQYSSIMLTITSREDGTIDHASAANRGGAGHKLGPKANQGAINAGLRALDRSGKPCRKWAKGGFTLKSFTGVVWEIPRWTAPQKNSVESGTEDSTTVPSADSSSKENKENGQEGNSASNSNVAGDVEMQSAPSINDSSPAPMAIAAAS